jgi:hypothetical protein
VERFDAASFRDISKFYAMPHLLPLLLALPGTCFTGITHLLLAVSPKNAAPWPDVGLSCKHRKLAYEFDRLEVEDGRKPWGLLLFANMLHEEKRLQSGLDWIIRDRDVF